MAEQSATTPDIFSADAIIYKSQDTGLYDESLKNYREDASKTVADSFKSGTSAGFTYTFEHMAMKHWALSTLPGDLEKSVTPEAAAKEGITIPESISERHFTLLQDFRDDDAKVNKRSWDNFTSGGINGVTASAGFLLGLFANPSTLALGGVAKGAGVLASKLSGLRFLSTGARGGAAQLFANATRLSNKMGGQHAINTIKPVINTLKLDKGALALQRLGSVSKARWDKTVGKMFTAENVGMGIAGVAEVNLYDELESELGNDINTAWVSGLAFFAPAALTSVGRLWKARAATKKPRLNKKATGKDEIEDILIKKGDATVDDIGIIQRALDTNTVKGPLRNLAENFVLVNKIFNILPALKIGYNDILGNFIEAGIDVLPTDIFRWTRGSVELAETISHKLGRKINVDEVASELAKLPKRESDELVDSLLRLDEQAVEAINASRPKVGEIRPTKEATIIEEVSSVSPTRAADDATGVLEDTIATNSFADDVTLVTGKSLDEITVDLTAQKAKQLNRIRKIKEVKPAPAKAAEGTKKVEKVVDPIDEIKSKDFDNLPTKDRVDALNVIEQRLQKNIKDFIECRKS